MDAVEHRGFVKLTAARSRSLPRRLGRCPPARPHVWSPSPAVSGRSSGCGACGPDLWWRSWTTVSAALPGDPSCLLLAWAVATPSPAVRGVDGDHGHRRFRGGNFASSWPTSRSSTRRRTEVERWAWYAAGEQHQVAVVRRSFRPSWSPAVGWHCRVPDCSSCPLAVTAVCAFLFMNSHHGAKADNEKPVWQSLCGMPTPEIMSLLYIGFARSISEPLAAFRRCSGPCLAVVTSRWLGRFSARASGSLVASAGRQARRPDRRCADHRVLISSCWRPRAAAALWCSPVNLPVFFVLHVLVRCHRHRQWFSFTG